MIALIDYGAGNLTSVRKALAALGAEVFTPDVAAQISPAPTALIVPGVGHFGATAALDARGATRSWRTRRARHAAARHLPRHAVAVRGQRRGAGRARAWPAAWRCCSSRPDANRRAASDDGSAQGAARRLERAEAPTRPSRLLAGVAAGAQVYFTHSYAAPVGAGDRGDDDARPEHVRQRRRARQRLRRAVPPREVGRRRPAMLRNFCHVHVLDSLICSEIGALSVAGTATMRRSASSPASTCATARSSRACKFEGLRNAGDPAELARALQRRGHRRGRHPRRHRDARDAARARRTRSTRWRANLFMPLAVGGGIRTEDDAAAAVDAGADKVSLNTAALDDPDADHALAGRYGSQAVIVAIDAKRGPTAASRWFAVYVRSGTSAAGRDAVEWAREAADARRRRDPADVDGSRRHAQRLRLRADRRGVARRRDSGDRLGRRRHRSITSPTSSPAAAPTRRWPRRSSTSPSTASPT